MAAACPAPARPAAPAAGGEEKGRGGIESTAPQKGGEGADRQAGMDEQMNGWMAGCRDASRERGRNRHREGGARAPGTCRQGAPRPPPRAPIKGTQGRYQVPQGRGETQKGTELPSSRPGMGRAGGGAPLGRLWEGQVGEHFRCVR